LRSIRRILEPAVPRPLEVAWMGDRVPDLRKYGIGRHTRFHDIDEHPPSVPLVGYEGRGLTVPVTVRDQRMRQPAGGRPSDMVLCPKRQARAEGSDNSPVARAAVVKGYPLSASVGSEEWNVLGARGQPK